MAVQYSGWHQVKRQEELLSEKGEERRAIAVDMLQFHLMPHSDVTGSGCLPSWKMSVNWVVALFFSLAVGDIVLTALLWPCAPATFLYWTKSSGLMSQTNSASQKRKFCHFPRILNLFCYSVITSLLILAFLSLSLSFLWDSNSTRPH